MRGDLQWTIITAKLAHTIGNITHSTNARYFVYIADTVLIRKLKQSGQTQRLVSIIC